MPLQHISERVLRRMQRRVNRAGTEELIARLRSTIPGLTLRTTFIVGFPGETEADVAELHRFLSEAGLDAIGVFGYSDEDGTEAATLDGQLDPAEIARRVDDLAGLADELMAQRAADRVGEVVEVLLEEDLGGGRYLGRAAHQAPEVDGTTTVLGAPGTAIGEIISARVTEGDGVDLVADALAAPRALPGRAGAH
jgi:tRNA A37 methylthiotransferase MiaB